MYTCNQCGYNTKIKCNYVRHLNKKIKCEFKVNDDVLKNNDGALKNNDSSLRNKFDTLRNKDTLLNNGGYSVFNETHIECNLCRIKMLKRCFKRHQLTCKKVPLNCCQYCERQFNTQPAKSQHQKICKLNPVNMEIKVEPVPDQPSSSNIGTQIVNNYYLNNSTLNNDNSTVNNSTVNNSTVNNNNLTMNNNTNITYTSFGRENLDHLTSQVMIDPRVNNIRKCYRDTVDLSHFNADHPENQTVRKTNLKSNLIEFRTHQNKWEYESDKAGFRKIRKNLEQKFNTKFDDVDDMTLTAFNEMLYRQTQRGLLPEEEILNKYKSIKYVEAMCDAQVDKLRVKYLDEMELPHDHKIPIYGQKELREEENKLRKTYGLPLKPEIEFVSCTERWRNS